MPVSRILPPTLNAISDLIVFNFDKCLKIVLYFKFFVITSEYVIFLIIVPKRLSHQPKQNRSDTPLNSRVLRDGDADEKS